MNVLYVHQHFSTPRGATGTRSYEFARHLVAEGHDVTVLCGSSRQADTGLRGTFRRGRREGRVDGIRVIELDIPYSNHDRFGKRTVAFLRFALGGVGISLRAEYDVVFATSTPLTAGIPGIVARWLRRKPFVFEVRDLWPEAPREMGAITNPAVLAALDGLEWVAYHSAHHLIGLSPGIVNGIVRRGIPKNRVALIPNGCDLELFDPTRHDRESASIPGVGEGDFVAAFAGAHGMANGLDSVLDAAVVLTDRGRTDIKVVLIGDGAQKAALMKRACAAQLDNCIFLDPLPKGELARLLSRVDVGLMVFANVPAFYQGTSPNKFFDYLASGTPVLNNYPGWVADLIRAHDCGVVVEPGRPEAFADALEGLARYPERLPAMAASARHLAEQMFARRDLANRFRMILEDQIDVRPGRGPTRSH